MNLTFHLSMKSGRSYADAVINAVGEVWVTGGWDGQHRHNTTEVMSGSTWTPGHSLTFSRYQHCGVTLSDGSVVITGGQEGLGKQGSALNTVERYKFGGPVIQTLPDMQQARWTHACGVFFLYNREAVIVAGGRVTSGPGDELASVEVMVVGESYWQTRQPLPQPRLSPSMVVINNIPQLSGGNYDTGARRQEVFPDTVLEYHGEADQWRPVARLMGRSHHAAVAIPVTLVTSC